MLRVLILHGFDRVIFANAITYMHVPTCMQAYMHTYLHTSVPSMLKEYVNFGLVKDTMTYV